MSDRLLLFFAFTLACLLVGFLTFTVYQSARPTHPALYTVTTIGTDNSRVAYPHCHLVYQLTDRVRANVDGGPQLTWMGSYLIERE